MLEDQNGYYIRSTIKPAHIVSQSHQQLAPGPHSVLRCSETGLAHDCHPIVCRGRSASPHDRYRHYSRQGGRGSIDRKLISMHRARWRFGHRFGHCVRGRAKPCSRTSCRRLAWIPTPFALSYLPETRLRRAGPPTAHRPNPSQDGFGNIPDYISAAISPARACRPAYRPLRANFRWRRPRPPRMLCVEAWRRMQQASQLFPADKQDKSLDQGSRAGPGQAPIFGPDLYDSTIKPAAWRAGRAARPAPTSNSCWPLRGITHRTGPCADVFRRRGSGKRSGSGTNTHRATGEAPNHDRARSSETVDLSTLDIHLRAIVRTVLFDV